MFKLGQDHLPARHGVAGAGHHIQNTPSARRSGQRAIRGGVLLAGLLGSLAALAASGVPADAVSQQTVTAGPVTAISSFYDPPVKQLHVFSATPSGVQETYWSSGGAKTTGPINNVTGISGISSFYDPATGGLHVFSATPSGVYETYWSNTNGTKHTDKINSL